MVIAILVAISVVCAVGWLASWVGNAAIAKWIIDKGYTPPTDEELSECASYVMENMLRGKWKEGG